MMSSGRYYQNLTWGSVVKCLFEYVHTSKKKLALTRISPRNIYLNFFGEGHVIHYKQEYYTLYEEIIYTTLVIE